MQIQTHKTQKILKKLPAKACLITSGALLVAGSIGMTYSFTRASQSDYSLTENSITLDGSSDGSVAIPLKTSVAHNYVAMQGTWSLHEVVETGATQTSHLSLSSLKRGGTTTMTFGATTGTGVWTPEDGNGMQVDAGGEVITAIYSVDKNTPAGTYKVTFSNGLFTYSVNNVDVDENDTIALDTTITVARSETENNNNNNDDGNNNNDGNDDDEGNDDENGNNDNNNNDGGNTNNDTNNDGDGKSSDDVNNNDGDDSTDDSEADSTGAATTESDSDDGSESGVAVPDTGEMTQDDSKASAVAISVAAVVVVAVLSVAAVQAKNHKKIDFNKS